MFAVFNVSGPRTAGPPLTCVPNPLKNCLLAAVLLATLRCIDHAAPTADLAIGDAEFLDHAIGIEPVAASLTKAFMDRRSIEKEAAR